MVSDEQLRSEDVRPDSTESLESGGSGVEDSENGFEKDQSLQQMKTDTPHAEHGSNGSSRLVMSGAVRSPDESNALSVAVTIDDFEVTMSAGRAEIGKWLTSTVTIRRIDDASFEFIAEGDRLIFVPEDPDTFGAHPAVGEPEDDKRRRRREKQTDKAAKKSAKQAGKAAKKTKKSAKKTEAHDEKPRSRRALSKERRHDRGMDAETEPQEVEPSVPTLQNRTAAIEAMIGGDATNREPAPEETEAVVTRGQSQGATEPTTEDGRRVRWRRRHAMEESEPDEEPGHDGDVDDASKEPEDDLNRLWIRALDAARRYDLFNLDRVPIDESLRGHEHEHTWNHRVALSSGAGAHICTICGKIRR